MPDTGFGLGMYFVNKEDWFTLLVLTMIFTTTSCPFKTYYYIKLHEIANIQLFRHQLKMIQPNVYVSTLNFF